MITVLELLFKGREFDFQPFHYKTSCLHSFALVTKQYKSVPNTCRRAVTLFNWEDNRRPCRKHWQPLKIAQSEISAGPCGSPDNLYLAVTF